MKTTRGRNAEHAAWWCWLVQLGLLVQIGWSAPVGGQAGLEERVAVRAEVDWAEYLHGFEMSWERLPGVWTEAPFLGNGELGGMAWLADPRTWVFGVGSSAVHDHRPVGQDDLRERAPEVLNRGRLPVGRLELRFPADVTGGTGWQSLYRAEAGGELRTDGGGTLTWEALVHADEPVMRITVEGTGVLAGADIAYVPAAAESSRAVQLKLPRKPANPPARSGEEADGVKVVEQALAMGGLTVVAWKEAVRGGRRVLWLSVHHSHPGGEARARALAAVRAAAAADQDAWVRRHRDWWAGYFPRSFLSTGDPFWDGFYWLQQYKVACATRPDGWVIDNQGPWLQPSPWNATWWNLNVQLSYSGLYAANRLDLAGSLSHRLAKHSDSLVRNVAAPYRHDSAGIGRNSSGWDLLAHAGEPGGREGMPKDIGAECGNLLWVLHNVDLEYRYSGDKKLRDGVLYPLLVRAVNYYRHFLKPGDDGRLHLPATHSPEYGEAADASYDLFLLDWGLGRLAALAAERGGDEPLLPIWEDVRKRLVKPHRDGSGLMIGRGVPYAKGHRHWSHLLGIYPLRTLTPEHAGDRELIRRSLELWHSLKGGLVGYSYTGGACIAALLGDGARAYELLDGLKTFLHPNTFYTEAGGAPVIETPLHAATAIQEMLMQSWGGRLRVFPALPGAWRDARFHRMRAEGAFLVSAVHGAAGTEWVVVEAEHGGCVELDAGWPTAAWDGSDVAVKVDAGEGGVQRLVLPAGGRVMLWPAGGDRPEPVLRPCPSSGGAHRFGLPAKAQAR